LPSLSHDRVRNVLASPLAGLDRGPDLTGIVRALDAALCARPRLAELPGRFLFAVDDGRGGGAGLGADVVAAGRTGGAVGNGLTVRCPPGGGAGARDGVPDELRDGVVAAMLACADAFLDLRAESSGTAWRIADLPGGADRVRAAAAARLGLDEGQPETEPDVALGDAAPGCAAGVAGAPGATTARPVGLVTRLEARLAARGETGGGAVSAASVPDDPDASA